MTNARLSADKAPRAVTSLKTINGVSIIGLGDIAVAAAGGSESDFNLTNQIAYTATTSLSSTGFSVPASNRAIVRSIRVANIHDTAAADITVQVNINGGSNVKIANLIPVAKGGSVELLKNPKVLNVSDTIHIQGSINSALQAIISWEQTTTTDYVNAGGTATATLSTLFTSAGAAATVCNSILLTNIDGVYNRAIDVVWTNAADVVQAYLVKNYTIPAKATIEILESAIRIPTGHKIRYMTPVANTVSAYVSGKNI